MMPPIDADLACTGSTTLQTTSQVVAAEAVGRLLEHRRHGSNTSRIIAVMKGITMIARMMPGGQHADAVAAGLRTAAPSIGSVAEDADAAAAATCSAEERREHEQAPACRR
jgi:hypothetical protein